MKKYFQIAQSYVVAHKKEFTIGSSVIIALAVFLTSLALYSYNTRQPSVVYEPASACDLLTMKEAKTMLGDKTVNGVSVPPTQSGNLTVSKCSYSDGLPDTSRGMVAAISVRTGINDQGILLNNKQFVAGKPSAGIQEVPGVGDAAYYNAGLGQLNVLKDSTWILVSFGSATDPQGNSLEETVKLANLALNAQ